MPLDTALRIEENRHLGAAHFLLTLSAPPGSPPLPSWKAGQFAMIGLGLPGPTNDPLLRRPFSIFEPPPQRQAPASSLRIFYKVLGRGTALLARARPGTTVPCLAPLGNGFDPPRAAGSRLLLVAGGIGAASLHPLAVQELREGRSPLMLYGCRTAADLAGIAPSREAGIEVRVATDDGTAGASGRAGDLLDRFLRDEGPQASRRWIICACGPHAMMRHAAQVAARHGVPCHVSLESPMACGFGVCVGCVVGVRDGAGEPLRYRRICVEGPVFDAAVVAW
ncbi:MAG TPA: dihydroorotate dehydrogenase electron transfer subunit [Candidatus Polarisedimenticolia bacterium]|nr:dihydroorotate dehydrogenase electron transfer subunit [Candidatus Polarisedimenticolia bacterium]